MSAFWRKTKFSMTLFLLFFLKKMINQSVVISAVESLGGYGRASGTIEPVHTVGAPTNYHGQEFLYRANIQTSDGGGGGGQQSYSNQQYNIAFMVIGLLLFLCIFHLFFYICPDGNSRGRRSIYVVGILVIIRNSLGTYVHFFVFNSSCN